MINYYEMWYEHHATINPPNLQYNTGIKFMKIEMYAIGKQAL
jgi:hypothetical protein